MSANNMQAENGDLLDQTFNRILKEGVKALDKDGNVVTLTPSAAMLNAIRARVRDLGINAMPVKGSTTGDLIENAVKAGIKFNGRAIPPIDLDDDDAATG